MKTLLIAVLLIASASIPRPASERSVVLPHGTAIIPAWSPASQPEVLSGTMPEVSTASPSVARHASPRSAPSVRATGHIGHPVMGGLIGYAKPSHGLYYLAMRLPRGTVVRICGPGGCLRRITTDYGPKASIKPTRLADVSYVDFVYLCDSGHKKGLCRANATLIETIELPATDTE